MLLNSQFWAVGIGWAGGPHVLADQLILFQSDGQIILLLWIIAITLLLLQIFQTSYGPAGVAQDPKEDKEGINDHEE